jgi:hypothetical protein
VILGKSLAEIAEFTVPQCQLILRAAERKRARQALLELRTIRLAIVNSFSNKHSSKLTDFVNELARVLESEPDGRNKEDTRANQRAAAAAAAKFGARLT